MIVLVGYIRVIEHLANSEYAITRPTTFNVIVTEIEFKPENLRTIFITIIRYERHTMEMEQIG